MLVLSRKLNEKIVIDGNIVVTVVKVDRNTVRLGIQAPESVSVLRSELIPGHELPSGRPERDRAPILAADPVVIG